MLLHHSFQSISLQTLYCSYDVRKHTQNALFLKDKEGVRIIDNLQIICLDFVYFILFLNLYLYLGYEPTGVCNSWGGILGASHAGLWYWIYQFREGLTRDKPSEASDSKGGPRAPLAFSRVWVEFLLNLWANGCFYGLTTSEADLQLNSFLSAQKPTIDVTTSDPELLVSTYCI